MMRFNDIIGPGGERVHVWVSRNQQGSAGMRPQPFVGRMPAVVTHIPHEDAIKLGLHEGTYHRLTFPNWKTAQLQVGDTVTSVRPRDGSEYVRPAKAWSVVDLVSDRAIGDAAGQVAIVREPI